MSIILLALASFVSWLVSTLAGGGTPLILIPLIGFFLGSVAVPPVLTTVMLVGHPQRLFLYRKHICWRLMWWYLPGAIVGAVLGAFIYTQIQLEWLPLLLAMFLITSTATYGIGGQESSFKVAPWYFLPSGFIFAFISGLIGSTGPLLNPLYINYGLVKEEMIATKSAHLVVIHIAKMITYGVFGALNWHYLGYGLLMGVAAFPGNWLGQIILQKVSEQNFRKLLVGSVLVTSLFMLWEQKDLFLHLVIL